VNANVGEEVTQQVVAYQTRADTITRDDVRGRSVTVRNDPSPLFLLLLVLGWLLPSPAETGRLITRATKRAIQRRKWRSGG